MLLLVYLVALAVPFVGTSLLVPVVARFCLDRGLLDQPGGRKQHRAPVPRLGGLAFFVSFSASVTIGFALAPHLSPLPAFQALFSHMAAALSEAHLVAKPLFGLLAGALIIFLVGLVDDLLGDRFPVGLKFLGQCVAAGTAVACGIQVEFTGSGVLNVVVSFLWILGISNAFNLLDNMDGLSAGVAVCSGFIFFLNAFALGEIFLCLILAAFMGALLGFLRFNSNPARIFRELYRIVTSRAPSVALSYASRQRPEERAAHGFEARSRHIHFLFLLILRRLVVRRLQVFERAPTLDGLLDSLALHDSSSLPR